MEIIYIITTLLLFILTMTVKKSDEKQNILFRGVLNIILFTIYNILIGLIFFVIKVPYTLLALSIANIALSAIFGIIIYKKKEVQKYFIRIQDIIFMIILLVLVIGFAVIHYGIPFSIKYETTDPAIHFMWAKDFYNNKTLTWGSSMPAAYINTALLFDIFDNIVAEQDFYYIYIVFDLIILYLIGAIFYLGITRNTKSMSKSIIAMIFSILFLCAYPLNSTIFGFAYLSVGILYMTTLIVTAVNIKNEELKFNYICIEMFLLLFGIFFSYYFFVPVIYVAFGLYMLFDMIKNRKTKNVFSIFTIKNVIKVFTILILPTILGFIYFVLPGLIQSGKTAIKDIIIEGYIYRDLYSNFVLFSPLAIYYILYNIKNKKNSFSTILIVVASLFTIYLLRKGIRGEASSYYYYKMYFLLWILVVYMNIKAMFIMIENKNGILSYSFTIVILALLGILCTGLDYKVTKANILFNPTNSINSYTNIYAFNKNRIGSKQAIYSKTQLEAIKYVLNSSENKSNILINGNGMQMLWANSVWKITDTEDVRMLQVPEELDINKWNEDNNKKYLIFFDINKEIDRNSEKYKVIYEKEDAIILEKTNI